MGELTTECRDIAIIGAGISGLSLAHYAARADWRTLVIDRSERPGGCFHTLRTEDGFWLELGAHTCYNSYSAIVGMVQDLGLRDSLLRRGKVPYRLLSGGRTKSIASALNFAELVFSAPRMLFSKKAGRTVAEYYSSIAGRGNYERALGPLLSAVPCQRADDMPADMLFKSRKRRRDFPRSFTFQGGLQALTDAIASEEGVELVKGAQVEGIEFRNKAYVIALSDGRSFEAQALGLAVPPHAAAGFLKDLAPGVSEKLSLVESVTVDSVGVVVKKGSVGMEPVAGLVPVEDDAFWSVVSRDYLPHESLRGFTFHFKPGLDREKKLKRVGEVLGTGDFEAVVETTATLPALRPGHDRLVAEMDREIAFRRLAVTGNYLAGLAIEDCALRSRSEFERLRKLVACI
ncbi:MAG: FAD-dependent oxidoreductase [Thermodesulfovibrionales bacterium]